LEKLTARPRILRLLIPIIIAVWLLAVLRLRLSGSDAWTFEGLLSLTVGILGAGVILLAIGALCKEQKKMRGETIQPADEFERKTILESLPDALTIMDFSGRILFCNWQGATMLGYETVDELSHRSILDLAPEAEHKRLSEYLQRIREGGAIKEVQLTIVRKDGAHFHAEIRASASNEGNGFPATIIATIRNITEHKWIEAQIRESEMFYRVVADNTFEWEFWQAPNNRYIYLSPSCKRISGYDDVEFISDTDLFINIIHPDDRGKFKEYQRRMLGERKHGEIEIRILCADGRECWINQVCQPVFDENGIFMGVRGSNRDVTKRKIAEDELHRVNEKLRLQLEEINVLQAILREQAFHDPLTGLYNRRYLEDALKKEQARALRAGYPVSIAILDMDNLKQINDTYGYNVGDKVLTILSGKLRELTRLDDTVCRYGGDEFLAILYNTSLENAYYRVEEWRVELEKTVITHQDANLRVTFTAGVAAFPQHGKTLDETIISADVTLYHAKKSGRNRVMTAGQRL
jgi:diguanylate cyclase (GGDEF)-like protein/PAS domain S-box-containing protein